MILSAEKKAKQQNIAEQIYQEIVENGGDFFDRDGNAKTNVEAKKNIRKLLKDYKTCGSTAVVQAMIGQVTNQDEVGLFDEAFLDDLVSESSSFDWSD